MANPQSPEAPRNLRGGGTAKSAHNEGPSGQGHPSTSERLHAVPEDNQPGHHPDHGQDRPVEKFRRRARQVAAEAHHRQREGEWTEVEIDGLTFRGQLAGPEGGELVVLLHGFPQHAGMWSPVLHRLAEEGFRVWAPDQRGYSPGARPGRIGDYRVEKLVGDVVAQAGRLGHHSFHLVGHDWGGMVGWATAFRHPQMVDSLTVLSTPHPRALIGSLLRSDQLLRSSYFAFFELPAIPERALALAGGRLLKLMLTGSGLPAETAEDYARTMAEEDALGPALNWYRAATAAQRVGPVASPTLLVWGEGDPALGRSAIQRTARWVEGSYRLEILPGAGHWLVETRPEIITQLILSQVSDVSRALAG
jgi:pimeloyl-ACP methyl ester carboxylesterase